MFDFNEESSETISSNVLLNTQNEKNIVNCVRWLNKTKKENVNFKFTKNDIANILSIQWITASKTIDTLKKEHIIKCDKDTEDIELFSNIENYIGVSLGSSRVKITGIDFNFDPIILNQEIKQIIRENLSDYIALLDNTQNQIESIDGDKLGNLDNFELCFNLHEAKHSISILDLLNDICKLVIHLKDKLKIGSIGFAFPGIVDYDAKIIRSSYLLRNLSDLTISDLLDEDIYDKFKYYYKNNYTFDHNSNAACVAEKELGNVARALQGKNNLLVIYGGYGYGVGLVLNNKLFLGTKKGGQLGHIQITPYNNLNQDLNYKCRCGMYNCLENRINVDVFGETPDIEESLKYKSIDKLCAILKEGNHKEIFSDYLSQAIYTLSQLFGTEDIVLTGKLTEFYNIIKNELKNKLLNKYCINHKNVKPSILGEFAAAKGAAIEAYYYKHKMPLEWK